METSDSIVLDFPKRTCEDCLHAAFSVYGIFCKEFMEDVIDEKIAQECNSYEPI